MQRNPGEISYDNSNTHSHAVRKLPCRVMTCRQPARRGCTRAAEAQHFFGVVDSKRLDSPPPPAANIHARPGPLSRACVFCYKASVTRFLLLYHGCYTTKPVRCGTPHVPKRARDTPPERARPLHEPNKTRPVSPGAVSLSLFLSLTCRRSMRQAAETADCPCSI